MAESSNFRLHPEISGWLYKWTNYISRYQKRWFVLSNGFLSYYRNQEEMTYTCRGTLSLHGAMICSEDQNDFVVSNGETYHIKATSEVEKEKWINALRLAKDKSSLNQASIPDTTTTTAMVVSLKKVLEDVKTCNSLVKRHGQALQRSLSEIENSTIVEKTDFKVKEVNRCAALFRVSTTSMVRACSDYLDLAECHSNKWVTLLQSGNKKQIQFNKVVKSLTQFPYNEFDMNEHEWERLSDDEVPVYYDCEDLNSLSGPPDCLVLNSVVCYPAVVGKSEVKQKSNRERRTRVPDKPNVSANLWNIIKNAVGKDLTKIPVPVNFSEPLSLLQRLTEDFEYADLLDKASTLTDPAEQIAYVTCFGATCYSTTTNRTGKPFNPILGETFECDRTDDLGWKSIAEQVSHHPPIAALHCEGKTWECWTEQSMQSKFRGQYFQIVPLGETHVKFKNGNHYAWKKVNTNVHNIIIGKLWIDQEGDMDVKCYTNGYTSKLSFLTSGYFGGDSYKVMGTVFNKNGDALLNISGGYDSKLEISRVATSTAKSGHKTSKVAIAQPEERTLVWERRMPAPDSEKYYNFTVFACQLNEMEDGVAPTDSRRRPDQRFMEEGKFNLANETKVQLEDLQRSMRKQRQGALTTKSNDSFDPFEPNWFAKGKDNDTHTEMYIYRGQYWQCKKNQDWSKCPKIYLQ